MSDPTKVTTAPVVTVSVAKSQSVEAAQSVADAVAKVANAAVAEVQKQPAAEAAGDFTFAGTPGGRFRIQGAGLGTNGGVVIGGVAAETTAWGSTNIEGRMPASAKAGDEVVVHIDAETRQKARYRG